ncbi:MAG: FAD:protein FMN transferase [Rhodobacter sp.]|nr:FAD:protein FMN transferase [Rhodobacter sp.]
MTLTRRRFLTISAAFAGMPSIAQAESWQGYAFGAEVSLTIRGPRQVTVPALAGARALLREVERRFSLYDPDSDLSRLNATGRLALGPGFHALLQAADHAHRITGGLFDPTVQPLWLALADGRDPGDALRAVGWNRVRFDLARVALDRGQALTFNGIAQGYATDLITESLAARGLTDLLVNIGEYRGIGGPWRLGLSDPVHGHLGTRTLTGGAIATSSPAAMSLGRHGHILHPAARPQWSTVAVEAPNAMLADSLSTAMTLAPRDQIEAILKAQDGLRVTLVDFDGNLTTL